MKKSERECVWERERQKGSGRERSYFHGFFGFFVGGQNSDSGTVLTTQSHRSSPSQTLSMSSLQIESWSTRSSNSLVVLDLWDFQTVFWFRVGVTDREPPVVFMIDGFPFVHVVHVRGRCKVFTWRRHCLFCGQWCRPNRLQSIWTQTDTHWKWNDSMFSW